MESEVVVTSKAMIDKNSLGPAILQGRGVDFPSGYLAYELSGEHDRGFLRIFDSGNIDAFGI